MKLKFRPHHFLCTLGFEGKGYSADFVRNYQKIADRLRKTEEGDQIEIEVVSQTDSICSPCPHRRETLCESQRKIESLDDAHAKMLGLRTGESLTWGEAKERIVRQVTDEAFHQSCAPCSWKALGVCEAALKQLRKGASAALIILVPLVATISEAAPPPTPASVSEVHQRFVAGIRAGDKSGTEGKGIKALQEAYEHLKSGKYTNARKLAAPYQSNSDYEDMAMWIVSSGFLGESSKALQAKHFDQALTSARQGASLLLQLQGTHVYSPFLKSVPEELARAELLTAEAHFGKGQTQVARTHYERAFQRYSNENKLGWVDPEAIAHFSKICDKSPSPVCEAWNQKFLKVRPPSYGPKLTQTYKAPDLDQAAYDEAISLYHTADYDDAAEKLEKFMLDFPKSSLKQRARFWLAQALKNDGEDEDAKAHFLGLIDETPLSYYGMVSALETGQNLPSRLDAAEPQASESDSYLAPPELIRLNRARRSIRYSSQDLAGLDLKDFRPRDTLSNPFLVFLASLQHDAGNHSSAFIVLSELFQRGYKGLFSSFGVRLIFPVMYIDLIDKYAKENSLDPLLVLSLMKQESAFLDDAVSSAGACGLMQLMPATAKDVDPKVTKAELLDPETNIRIGTKYLAQVIRGAGGNVAVALAGYNAGPGNAGRWLSAAKARPKDPDLYEYIESITYKETRDYVSSILRNYYWYSHKIRGETPKALGQFWVKPN